jgi:hypothetical protein
MRAPYYPVQVIQVSVRIAAQIVNLSLLETRRVSSFSVRHSSTERHATIMRVRISSFLQLQLVLC